MPFCRFCGAPKEDEAAICAKCNNQAVQYYIPPPPPQVQDDAGKALGIVAIVIAVIVIVTIVLAAVLYVMVIGFGSGGGTSTPVGAWQSMTALSETSGRITFGTLSPTPAWTDVQIFVTANGTNIGFLDCPEYSEPVSWVGGPSGAQAEYMDWGQSDSINSGDYITLTGLKPDTTYEFRLVYIPTEEVIVMIGSTSFTTPQ